MLKFKSQLLYDTLDEKGIRGADLGFYTAGIDVMVGDELIFALLQEDLPRLNCRCILCGCLSAEIPHVALCQRFSITASLEMVWTTLLVANHLSLTLHRFVGDAFIAKFTGQVLYAGHFSEQVSCLLPAPFHRFMFAACSFPLA